MTRTGVFLCPILADKSGWYVNQTLDDKLVKFKIDTGASVTAIPENLCRVDELDTPVRRLLGAGGHRLLTVGSFSGSLSYGSVRTDQTIYVIQGLKEPLLGKPAIIELDLVQFAKSVIADTDTLWLNKYPKLFSGLGKLQHIFDINLKRDVFATSVSVPRRVSRA